MNIAILGIGAIGSVMAWRLQQAQHQVFAADKARQIFLQQGITQHTLQLPKWSQQTLDWLIICTKAGQTLDAIQKISDKHRQIKQILCVQNGLGQHQALAKQIAHTPIWAGVSTEGAYRTTEQQVCYAAQGQTLVGVLAKPALSDAKRLPKPFILAENIELVMLNKLAVNAVINPLTAYFQCTNGELLSAQYKKHFVQLCHEIQTLYQALNLPAIEPFIQRVAQIAKQTKHNRSSSLQDVLAGRTTELAYISGYLLKRAQDINHPMPLTEFYLQQLPH